jgi:hypothetical protein
MKDLDHDHGIVSLRLDGTANIALENLDALSEPRLLYSFAGYSHPCGVDVNTRTATVRERLRDLAQ